MIFPASNLLASIIWIDTPVASSPLRIACCSGAAPAYFGSSDGWTLTYGWRVDDVRREAGSLRPKEATMPVLGRSVPGGCSDQQQVNNKSIIYRKRKEKKLFSQ